MTTMIDALTRTLIEMRNIFVVVTAIACMWAIAAAKNQKDLAVLASAIQPGMSLAHVIAIAGEPEGRSDTGSHTLISWRSDTQDLSVGLRDGTVYGVVAIGRAN